MRFRKNIIQINTMFKPHIKLFNQFENGDIKGYVEDMEDYWGNILDFYQKMWDMVDDYGELASASTEDTRTSPTTSRRSTPRSNPARS